MRFHMQNFNSNSYSFFEESQRVIKVSIPRVHLGHDDYKGGGAFTQA